MLLIFLCFATEIQTQRAELSVQKHETLLLQRRYEEERAQVGALRDQLEIARSSLAEETHAARSGELLLLSTPRDDLYADGCLFPFVHTLPGSCLFCSCFFCRSCFEL